MPAPLLTKSDFMAFYDCPIRLWLIRVRPDIGLPPDEGKEKLFEWGHEVDDLARGLFPGGVEVQSYNAQGFKNTQAAIAKGAKILYQPTAVGQGLSARADILTRGRGGKWDIHEVKISTSAREDHVYDLAFQRLAFEAAGIPINKTHLTHLNNEYVRQGDIEIGKLLAEDDLTDQVMDITPEVERAIPQAKAVLKWPQELTAEHLATSPDLAKSVYAGRWLSQLYPQVREQIMSGLEPEVAAKMLENGIVEMDGLSAPFVASLPYRTPEERWPFKIDRVAIKEELAKLEYPLHFFDYETFSHPIPPFDGYSPYKRVPFQFSLYVLDAPGAKPRIRDFLATEYKDPAPDCIAAMRKYFKPTGSVLAWYASFESSLTEELAVRHPEHAEFLRGINARMYDLIQPFKKKMYVNPACRGSNSIKSVLPVLAPELSYDKLRIHKGDEASASWPVITDPKTPAADREQLIKDEIEYCRLDVYGMVRILEELGKMVSPKNPFE